MEEGLFDEDEEKKRKTKILVVLVIFMVLSFVLLISTIIFIGLYLSVKKDIKEENTTPDKSEPDEPIYSPTQDRFIKVISKVTETGGAYVSQGKHDILNSKYYNYLDIYNMKSSGSLILLENFKTYQQTSEVTCGIASLIMAVYYLDGKVLKERDLAIRAGTNHNYGTLIKNLEKLVKELGYDYESKTTFTKDDYPSKNKTSFSNYIQKSLLNKEPIIVISNDWGGHYSVIIGYDDMGTKDYIADDVIILADPYDTTDHMSDGYTIFSYERFYAQMKIKVFNITDQDLNFIKIKVS